MDNNDYKQDAQYHLTVASSIADDLSNHAEFVMNEIDQKRSEIRDELDAVGGKIFSTGKVLIKRMFTPRRKANRLRKP